MAIASNPYGNSALNGLLGNDAARYLDRYQYEDELRRHMAAQSAIPGQSQQLVGENPVLLLLG